MRRPSRGTGAVGEGGTGGIASGRRRPVAERAVWLPSWARSARHQPVTFSPEAELKGKTNNILSSQFPGFGAVRSLRSKKTGTPGVSVGTGRVGRISGSGTWWGPAQGPPCARCLQPWGARSPPGHRAEKPGRTGISFSASLPSIGSVLLTPAHSQTHSPPPYHTKFITGAVILISRSKTGPWTSPNRKAENQVTCSCARPAHSSRWGPRGAGHLARGPLARRWGVPGGGQGP